MNLIFINREEAHFHFTVGDDATSISIGQCAVFPHLVGFWIIGA